MDLGLKGKKAIVTGATRGIGRAIAETLADEGADVAICARNQEQVNETVEALKQKGVHAIGGTVDVADGPALKAWIASVGKERLSASVRTLSLRATSTSKGACGTSSSSTCPICSKRTWGATRRDVWLRRRKLRRQSCSWQARPRPLPPAST